MTTFGVDCDDKAGIMTFRGFQYNIVTTVLRPTSHLFRVYVRCHSASPTGQQQICFNENVKHNVTVIETHLLNGTSRPKYWSPGEITSTLRIE